MNKENKVEFKHNHIEYMKDYLFDQIKSVVVDREIEIFQMQNENKYTFGKDNEFVNWLNTSTYARCFSRIALRARLKERWASISEVRTTLRCDD